MADERHIYEMDSQFELEDPDEVPIRDRKVITQPYDLGVRSLMDQIEDGVIFLRPLSERPSFQRRYVWTDKLASRLIESILLNVPIPPCYLSQNEEFELDVIDGQQRLFTIYRFVNNQFSLSNLEVLKELNGLQFFSLPTSSQRKITTHTLRCVLITNESHPEIKFEVFERLNTNTSPLNAQELRNCIYRGPLNDLLKDLVEDERWLDILGKKTPDKRMRDEELVLRFIAFQKRGVSGYRTPLKSWLNEVAKEGKAYTEREIRDLSSKWTQMLDAALVWFPPNECFRREGSRPINRALFDLIAYSAAKTSVDDAKASKNAFRSEYKKLLGNEEFQDLISRAVDHTTRTRRRFKLWEESIAEIL